MKKTAAADKPVVDPRVLRAVDRSVPEFPRPPWRRRLAIALLAVGMGWLVVDTMLDPPGNIKRNPPPRVDAPTCQPGQTRGCVGGTATIIVAPAPPAASR
jgi:hypothetical protein